MRKWLFFWFVAILMSLSFASPTQANTEGQLIIINKSTNELALFEGGKLIKVFQVATGRDNSYTPEGTFPIVNKIKNRPYYKENIPGGDERNPLGDRWIGLNARGTYGTTYAIHGNNNPNSIGTYASAGCIRMYDEEIHWLFNRIQVNTSVIILHSHHSFEAIAAANGYSTQTVPTTTQPEKNEEPKQQETQKPPVKEETPIQKEKPVIEEKELTVYEKKLNCIRVRIESRILFYDHWKTPKNVCELDG
ncbi:L,D-transpeptidase [Metabacillus herbersteinensis]|uniref:L,D-transpeptidase n=1 Tax=Metabacillus herbersteinensis TaxID=283816 RepID=A0ABV6GHG9_9BACI